MIKAILNEGKRPTEIAHPENNHAHPLSYLELPYDPEYSLYNNRMTPEYLNNATPDEQYWAVRKAVIFRNTGELPIEIIGRDAVSFANYIFTRDISKFKVGRCSYQLACYSDGGIITDGVMLHLSKDKLWMVQADGEIFNWYLAHAYKYNVTIRDPQVWVSQIQGPKSMHVLENAIDGTFPNTWRYFDIAEVSIAKEPVLITRTGFSNELGWEIYLRPGNNYEAIAERIWDVGKKYNMLLAGTPGFRARRIEAGLLSAGNDFNKHTTPFAVGLGRFVDLNKDDFLGISALKLASKKSKILGIKVRSGIADRTTFYSTNGEAIGRVTSSTWSPYLECGVGIVHIESSTIKEGTEVIVTGIDGKTYSGILCSLPMYDVNNLIVRGKDTKVPS